MAKRKFEVGQGVWFFDVNHRVYPEPPKGKVYCSSGPIYEKHYLERTIYGIEGRSYVIGPPNSPTGWSTRKYGFAKAERVFRTDEEKAADTYLNIHRYKIVRMVERCSDPLLLMKVAELVGYREEK